MMVFPKHVQALMDLLDDPNTPPDVQLDICIAWLDACGMNATERRDWRAMEALLARLNLAGGDER